MPNITEFKSPTGETLPIADTTARAEIGVLQQRADDTDHAMTDLDNAVKELQQSGTGGGGGEKVLDLRDYTATGGNMGDITFSDVVLTIFATGGGKVSVENADFWDDATTDKPLILKIDASALGAPYIIESRVTSIVKSGGEPVSIESVFLVEYGSKFYSVRLMFGKFDDGDTRILVVPEALNIATV